ncbi:hypothetical protein FRC11_012021, partial [Ceratobasidium sp. 423]
FEFIQAPSRKSTHICNLGFTLEGPPELPELPELPEEVEAFQSKTQVADAPWIRHNPSVNYFRQALALDENRGNFIPSLWDHSQTGKQNVLEVWFKGGHADVGGGAPQSPDVGKSSGPHRSLDLSNISLRWMVRQCLACPSARVLFDPDSMRRYREAQILESRPSQAEQGEIEAGIRAQTQAQNQGGIGTDIEREIARKMDSFDIGQAPYIALTESPLWWILECLPVPKLSQRKPDLTRPQGPPRRWMLNYLPILKVFRRKPKRNQLETVLNPSTSNRFIMLPAQSEDGSTPPHPFIYAKVLGVYHAQVSYGKGVPRREDFVHARWLYYDTDTARRGGCDDDIIRAIHLIPDFQSGPSNDPLTFPKSIAHDSDEHWDWKHYYVNRFVDPDILMRYLGGGIGHYRYTIHGSENNSDSEQNESENIEVPLE